MPGEHRSDVLRHGGARGRPFEGGAFSRACNMAARELVVPWGPVGLTPASVWVEGFDVLQRARHGRLSELQGGLTQSAAGRAGQGGA
jgi:hypothetical protein